MAEALNGTFKAELVKLHGPWRTRHGLEIATIEWVDWYNATRLHGQIGDIPPSSTRLTGTVTTPQPSPLGTSNSYCTRPGVLHFDTGDGHTDTADRPGGPHPDHAVAHVYETRNEPGQDYTLALTVTWQRATNYRADLVATTTTTTTTTQPYHVVEIRSGLTATP